MGVCVRGRKPPEAPRSSAERRPEVTASVEESVRADLARLPEVLRMSPLALLLLDLARRLDDAPEDRAAAMLSREFRLVLADLHACLGDTGGDSVERFLQSIANPALLGPGD